MKSIRLRLQSIFYRLKLTPATQMLILAVVIGTLGGFGALLFKKLIFTLQDFSGILLICHRIHC